MRYDIAASSLATLILLASATSAHAYLDPGTASLALQAIIGTLAAAGTAVFAYWRRIASFFARASKTDDRPPSGGK